MKPLDLWGKLRAFQGFRLVSRIEKAAGCSNCCLVQRIRFSPNASPLSLSRSFAPVRSPSAFSSDQTATEPSSARGEFVRDLFSDSSGEIMKRITFGK
jgi:hypothetical protein